MIENELKFVLNPTLLQSFADYPTVLVPANRCSITQCYYKRDARFRAIGFGETTSYTFTYKLPLPTGEVEEFEQIIDQACFERMYPLCDEVLIKDRYTIIDRDITWDIDFFRTKENTIYWIMAEAEMTPGMKVPDVLIPPVGDHLAYAVPRSETFRYTSRKLADHGYAKSLGDTIGISY